MHEVQTAPVRVPRYEAPGSLDKALQLLAAHGEAARPIAGGTDLVVELDRGAHAGVEMLVDLSRVAGLAEITVEADGNLVLGPMVTHNQVVASPLCRYGALPLAQACLEVGSPQLRNRATVAGNLVTASPANDTISALMALGASVELLSTTGRRRVPVVDFFTGFRATVRRPDELVTAIRVPAPGDGQRSVFVKSGLRRAQAISVVHLAVSVGFDDAGVVTTGVLALGSVAPTVIVVPDFADVMIGRRLDDDTIAAAADIARSAASPIDDLRASAEYRSDQVEVMVRRALRSLADGTHAQTWSTDVPMLWGGDFDGRFPPAEHDLSLHASSPITATVNGSTVTAGGAVGVTLLDWLRDGARLTGTKEGCAEGECGACTVHLDGAAVMSCLVPAARAHGSEVVTIEGLAGADGALHAVQEAFVECGAVQCGFCTPGLLMAAASLLDERAEPTDDQIDAALAGNLCRCTGYYSIRTAVERAAVHLKAER